MAIEKYAWSDESKKVKVYIDLPGVGALDDAALSLTHTKDTLSLRVDGLGEPARDYGLAMELNDEITGARLRKKENKVVLTLTKTGTYPWTALRKQ